MVIMIVDNGDRMTFIRLSEGGPRFVDLYREVRLGIKTEIKILLYDCLTYI